MDPAGLVAAIDAATGDELWAADLPCGMLVPHGRLLTIVGQDRNVDGGYRLVVVDAATGKSLSNEPFLDGYDDQVAGFEGAISVGSNTVVTGLQANLVVLAEDGTEIARQPSGLGYPIGEADGVAIIGEHNHAIGYDPVTNSELWTLDVNSFSAIAATSGSLWSLDRKSGTVSRLDPTTGTSVWTIPIGRTTSFDVAARAGIAFIVTTQAVIAVDNNSGEIAWTQHRPYEAED